MTMDCLCSAGCVSRRLDAARERMTAMCVWCTAFVESILRLPWFAYFAYFVQRDRPVRCAHS